MSRSLSSVVHNTLAGGGGGGGKIIADRELFRLFRTKESSKDLNDCTKE